MYLQPQNERPIIKIKRQKIDWILEISTFLVLILMWIYVAFCYSKLPAIIPTHFDFKGKADHYGSKMTIWILPVIISLIVFLFNVLSYYPHKFNYIVTINNENAERQYRIAVRVMRILAFNVTLLFSFIIVKINASAFDGSSDLEWWFIPLLLISMIAPTIYMVIVSGAKK